MASERYTRKDAEKAFERLCAAVGKRAATAWNDEPQWWEGPTGTELLTVTLKALQALRDLSDTGNDPEFEGRCLWCQCIVWDEEHEADCPWPWLSHYVMRYTKKGKWDV